MNVNTKIITNLAIAIMKNQKRERPVREKDQRTSQSPSPSLCKGEAKGRWHEREMKCRELKRRQRRAKSSPTELNRRDWLPEALPIELNRRQQSWIVANGAESSRTELNRRDRRAEVLPLSLIDDASAPLEWVFATASWSVAVELNRLRLSSTTSWSIAIELNWRRLSSTVCWSVAIELNRRWLSSTTTVVWVFWLGSLFFCLGFFLVAQREFVKWYWYVCGSLFYFWCAGYWN